MYFCETHGWFGSDPCPTCQSGTISSANTDDETKLQFIQNYPHKVATATPVVDKGEGEILECLIKINHYECAGKFKEYVNTINTELQQLREENERLREGITHYKEQSRIDRLSLDNLLSKAEPTTKNDQS